VQACGKGAHAFITCAQLHSAFCRFDFSEELRLRSAIALAARFHPKLRASTRLPQFPWQPVACARALRMRLTRQRCQLALRTLSSLGGDDAAKAASTSRRRISVAENLAPAIAIDADGDDRRDRDDASLLAHPSLRWRRSTDMSSRLRSDDKAFTLFVHERAELHDIVDHRWFLSCVGVSQPNPTGDSPVSTKLPTR